MLIHYVNFSHGYFCIGMKLNNEVKIYIELSATSPGPSTHKVLPVRRSKLAETEDDSQGGSEDGEDGGDGEG